MSFREKTPRRNVLGRKVFWGETSEYQKKPYFGFKLKICLVIDVWHGWLDCDLSQRSLIGYKALEHTTFPSSIGSSWYRFSLETSFMCRKYVPNNFFWSSVLWRHVILALLDTKKEFLKKDNLWKNFLSKYFFFTYW